MKPLVKITPCSGIRYREDIFCNIFRDLNDPLQQDFTVTMRRIDFTSLDFTHKIDTMDDALRIQFYR